MGPASLWDVRWWRGGRAPAPPRSFRPNIDIAGLETRVLVEQITAVTPERLGKSVGRLGAQELRTLDAALAVVLRL
jgi:mRNA interferase MazF